MRQLPHKNETPWLVWVYSGNIANALGAATWLDVTKELRNLGWKVDLISFGSNGIQEVKGVRVLCYSVPNLYFIRHLVFHLRVILHILGNWKGIDVVLFREISVPWILPLRLFKLFGRKHPLFVMDTRSVPMDAIDKAILKDKLRVQFMNFMGKAANNWTDGHTAITKRMAEFQHIPSAKLWGTWTSGVDPVLFSSALEQRRWLGNDDPVVVIYIGTLNYERNLMALSRSIVEANKRGMNLKLLLYGEGNEKKELEIFAKQTKGLIDVFNTVPHDMVPGILARAHIGALPFPDEDKYRVSSPIKLFEYMAAGLPILATRIVCHTDVIGSGDYVFWAEDATCDAMLNALEQIWVERSKLPLLGEHAYQASQNWTWKASANRLNSALRYGLSF